MKLLLAILCSLFLWTVVHAKNQSTHELEARIDSLTLRIKTLEATKPDPTKVTVDRETYNTALGTANSITALLLSLIGHILVIAGIIIGLIQLYSIFGKKRIEGKISQFLQKEPEFNRLIQKAEELIPVLDRAEELKQSLSKLQVGARPDMGQPPNNTTQDNDSSTSQ